MSLFQNIYGVLFRPSDTFKYLSVNYSPSLLLQAVLVLILVNLFSQGLNISSLLGSLINWFFFSSLFFLTAYVFILSGTDYWKTITMLAFANTPLIFLAPLSILSISNPLITLVLKLIISLWVFNLNLLAISEVCSIPKRKALLLYLIPPLVICFLFISFIVKTISNIAIMI